MFLLLVVERRRRRRTRPLTCHLSLESVRASGCKGRGRCLRDSGPSTALVPPLVDRRIGAGQFCDLHRMQTRTEARCRALPPRGRPGARHGGRAPGRDAIVADDPSGSGTDWQIRTTVIRGGDAMSLNRARPDQPAFALEGSAVGSGRAHLGAGALLALGWSCVPRWQRLGRQPFRGGLRRPRTTPGTPGQPTTGVAGQ
jgi:hypothetical protein